MVAVAAYLMFAAAPAGAIGTITVSPSSGPPGTPFVISSYGWTICVGPVFFYWDQTGPYAQVLGELPGTNPDSTLNVVAPNGPSLFDSYTIRATCPQGTSGPTVELQASTTFTLTPPSPPPTTTTTTQPVTLTPPSVSVTPPPAVSTPTQPAFAAPSVGAAPSTPPGAAAPTTKTPPTTTTLPHFAVQAARQDPASGGNATLLILVAVLLLGAVGVVAWRLRRVMRQRRAAPVRGDPPGAGTRSG